MTLPTAEQLLNLADRTPHGLTPDETARLRQGVAHHCARAEQAEAELTALKTITSGYCGHCGRGDCSPTADQWYEQRQRADRHEALLRQYLSLTDITHKYPIQGGHDCLGVNLTCAGCALADEIRAALARRRTTKEN